jgi:hypothetical protein
VDPVDHAAVEEPCELGGRLTTAADDLGDLRQADAAARVDTLRRVRHREVRPTAQAARLEQRDDDLLSRTRPRGRFQDDQLSRAEHRRDTAHGVDEEGEIGSAGEQRCGDRDDDHVSEDRLADVVREQCLVEGPELALRHVGDVRAALPQGTQLVVVDVDADRAVAGLRGGQQQRQADVAESDHHGDGVRTDEPLPEEQ